MSQRLTAPDGVAGAAAGVEVAAAVTAALARPLARPAAAGTTTAAAGTGSTGCLAAAGANAG